jgi:hypothetical protein
MTKYVESSSRIIPHKLPKLSALNCERDAEDDPYSERNLMGRACDIWFDLWSQGNQLTPPYISMKHWYKRMGYDPEWYKVKASHGLRNECLSDDDDYDGLDTRHYREHYTPEIEEEHEELDADE